MKLIVTSVDESDVNDVISALTGQYISLTHVSSTGGLLKPGRSTLPIGVEERVIPQVMEAISDLAGPRQSFIPHIQND